jgi:hypothetical protein
VIYFGPRRLFAYQFSDRIFLILNQARGVFPDKRPIENKRAAPVLAG